MKYFIFSDVHGFFSIFKEKLKELNFDEDNPDHMLISLGDNFDRGKENYQMFEFLKEMNSKGKIILVKGNHEDLLMEALITRKFSYRDYINGTYETIVEFSNKYFNRNILDTGFDTLLFELKNDGLIDLISSMKDYYETNNYIFTHGFIPVLRNESYDYNPHWRNSNNQEFMMARWKNGMEMSILYDIGEENKKIVIGHFHTSYGHIRKEYINKNNVDLKLNKNLNSDELFDKLLLNDELKKFEFDENASFDIYEDKNVIAIDGCTAFSNKVNVLVIND